jgi:hypothetical protein
MMNVEDLSDVDLSSLLAVFRRFAENGRNRFFFDLYLICEREGLRRTRSTEISDYSDRELNQAVQQLKDFVDLARSQGVNDEYPMLKFVRLALAAGVEELEKRERVVIN